MRFGTTGRSTRLKRVAACSKFTSAACRHERRAAATSMRSPASTTSRASYSRVSTPTRGGGASQATHARAPPTCSRHSASEEAQLRQSQVLHCAPEQWQRGDRLHTGRGPQPPGAQPSHGAGRPPTRPHRRQGQHNPRKAGLRASKEHPCMSGMHHVTRTI